MPRGFAGAVLLLAGAGISDGRAAAREPFLLGADISLAPEIERAGAVFKDAGKPADIFAIFHAHEVKLASRHGRHVR